MIFPDFPKIAILGATSFIGRHFLEFYRKKYPDCVGTSRLELNFECPNIVPLRLKQTGHKAALILAAITDVKTCEIQKERAREINVRGTLEVIKQLVCEGIKPIFASSDYVFEGTTGNYSEDDIPKPTTEYGKQKYEVETTLKDITGSNFLIIRYSKIFSLDKEDKKILHELADNLIHHRSVKAAHDQIFNPTLVSDLVTVVTLVQSKNLTGFIHACSPEVWSRYDLAMSMAQALKINPRNIFRVSLDELDLVPRRPKNTTLKCNRLQREIGFQFTLISQCIQRVARQFV